MKKEAMKLYNIYNNNPRDENIWEWFAEYLESEKKAVGIEIVDEMIRQLKENNEKV